MFKWIVGVLLCLGLEARMITDIPSGGMVISEPGTYVFGHNVVWDPSGGGQAILIESSDVTLDMRDFTLKSLGTGLATTGILVVAAENVTIKNGTVTNMGLGGIKCDGCAHVLIKNVIINGLHFSDIATYTVPTGILITASADAKVQQCTVKNIDVTTASMAAIQITETLASTVSHCVVKNLINRDGACTGIGHLLSDDAVIKCCTIDGLRSKFASNLNTAGHTAIGIIPVASANLVIKHCTISNITGCCDDAHGISVFECVGALVKKCQVENVLDGAGPAQTGAKATGIEVYASDVEVIECSAKGITAINPQSKQATGFSCAQCENVKFIKCHAEDVNVVDENGNQNASLGYGTGFGWAPDPRPEFVVPAVNILYQECCAKKCQVGFDSWFHIDSVWDHIQSICNGISVLDLDHSQRTLSCNACSECGCLEPGCYPDPLTVTVDNVARGNQFFCIKAKYCNLD